MSLQIVQPSMTRTRKKRSPSFPIAGTMKPMGLYPMWATVVLPGETLNSAEMKYRLISMPVKHPLVGATFETWLVFVSLTDIDAALAQMFISEGQPTTGFTAAADRPRFFTKSGQIDYLKLAVDRVVDAYFRDEGETTARTIDGVPKVKRSAYDWAQNLMFKPDDLDASYLPSALPEDGTLTPLEIMKLAGMSEITYEKYLMQYGVAKKTAMAEARQPEILRYTRDWTVPTNSIDPASGKPSSAWAWGATVKSEKAKRFDEAGFVIQLGCVRPKFFDSTLRASMIGELWGFADFFPVYNLDDPAGGLKLLEDNHKVLDLSKLTDPDLTPLMYDHRDLLSHGEQFVNDWSGPYALPTNTSRDIDEGKSDQDLRGQYPTDANINGVFVESSESSPADNRMRLYYEGIAGAEITGHVVDTTR